MNPNNANPTIVRLAPPCAAACAAPGTFVLVPFPLDGKLEIRPDAAVGCAPQGSGMLFEFAQPIGPIELAPDEARSVKRMLTDVLWFVGCGLGWHLNDGIPCTEPAFIRKARGLSRPRRSHYHTEEII